MPSHKIVGLFTDREPPFADSIDKINTAVLELVVNRLKSMYLGHLVKTVKDISVSLEVGCPLNMSVGACVGTSSPWTDVNGVDVTYIEATHTIHVGRGITRAPFFSPNWPKPMQLVTLGYKIALAYAMSLNVESTSAIKTCMFPDSSDRDQLFSTYFALAVVMEGIYAEAPVHRQTLLTIWAQTHCQGGRESTHTLVSATNETLSRLMGYYSAFTCPITPLLVGSNACIKS